MTKDRSSDEGFELTVEPPPPVDIRYKDPKTGKYVKRPGAVDAYRWMSFWLEPSVEATDTFFEQVLDPVWLEESPEPNARLLRSLREALAKESGNARTKAWRVLHRCTYISRVPDKVEQRPAAAAALGQFQRGGAAADTARGRGVQLVPAAKARALCAGCRVKGKASHRAKAAHFDTVPYFNLPEAALC